MTSFLGSENVPKKDGGVNLAREQAPPLHSHLYLTPRNFLSEPFWSGMEEEEGNLVSALSALLFLLLRVTWDYLGFILLLLRKMRCEEGEISGEGGRGK